MKWAVRVCFETHCSATLTQQAVSKHTLVEIFLPTVWQDKHPPAEKIRATVDSCPHYFIAGRISSRMDAKKPPQVFEGAKADSA